MDQQVKFTSGETIAERRIMGQLYVINRRLREFDMEFEEFCSLIRPAGGATNTLYLFGFLY